MKDQKLSMVVTVVFFISLVFISVAFAIAPSTISNWASNAKDAQAI
jgi:hypothetical protein